MIEIAERLGGRSVGRNLPPLAVREACRAMGRTQ